MENIAAKDEILTLPNGVTVDDYIRSLQKEYNDGSCFHVLDLGIVEKKYDEWKRMLPRVETFYAIKCNNDQVLAQALFNRGSGFDCASKREIEQALECGCPPDRIIFANPTKLPSDLEFAANHGVTMMTFDNADELQKISDAFKKVNKCVPEPIIRIVTDDSNSVCRFSAKYGAYLEDCEYLLKIALTHNLNIHGVSFHVGSGCASLYSFEKAIKDSSLVFELGKKLGHKMTVLDLGGGWPGLDLDEQRRKKNYENNKRLNEKHHDITTESITFAKIATHISPILDEYFPSDIQIIAEPGRYFAQACITFSSKIIARRLNYLIPSWNKNIQKHDPEVLYYIGDGIYGCFNGILYDHLICPVPYTNSTNTKRITKIFGPTCDGLDVLNESILFPELNIGDWITYPFMGAYSIAAQSSFNGIPRGKIFYVRSNSVTHCSSPMLTLNTTVSSPTRECSLNNILDSEL